MADLVLMLRRIRGDTVDMYMHFGVDGKLYVEVIKTWCFMAKEKNGFHRHAHQTWRSRKISITFHLQGMKMILSECEDCGVWALGQDSFQSRHEFGKNAATHQNGRLPVGVMVLAPPDFFVRLLMMNLRNEFHSSLRMWKAGKNNRGRYRACRSRPRSITLSHQIFHWMWRIFQIWWVLGYVQSSKTAVKPQKNNSFSFSYNKGP